MIKSAIFILILNSCTFVNGDVHSTCYPYDTYCLFSFGKNVTVKNVNEAQEMCREAKSGSWLLEIVDKRTLERVKKFLTDHSFPKDANLILNAEKYGNEKWKWIKSQKDVADVIIGEISNGDGNVKVFQPLKETGPNVPQRYTVICMIGCPSKLVKYEGMRYEGGTHYHNKNKEKCLESCEHWNCEAWEWETGYHFGCWIHQQIKGGMSINLSGTLYAINSSGKGYANCAHNVTEPYIRDSRQKDTVALYICLSILLMTLITVAAIIFWRRYKQKTELQKHDLQKNVYTFPVFSGLIDEASPSSPSSSSSTSYYLETKQPDTNSSGLVYADLAHLPKQKMIKKKDKSQKIGPMGDVYSQVKR